jgi:hypothetical protein
MVTLIALMQQTRAGRNNAGIAMTLDKYLPVYDFHEVHRIRIHAAPDRIFAALREVTPREMPLVRMLTAIRGLHTQAQTPLLAQMLQRNMLLSDEPDKEIVVGLIGQPWVLAGKSFSPRLGNPREYLEFHSPGCAKMAFNFRLENNADGSNMLLTETRVLLTDAASRKKFTAYWTVVYPGSSIIRKMWLEAVRKRAESPTQVP